MKALGAAERPEDALISLLFQVGEIPRALSVLQTIVDLTVEELTPRMGAHGSTSRGKRGGGRPTFAKTMIESMEAELNGRLIHCSLAVVDEPKCHVEFEVFAIAEACDDLDAMQVVRFYEHLLGEITPDRDTLRAFVCPDLGSGGSQVLDFAPLLLPLIGYGVGYLQSDLVGLVPYVPVSSIGLPNLELVPMPDGARFRSGRREVGSWDWLRWNWKPTHPLHQPSPTACCASLTQDAARQLIELLEPIQS